MNDTLAIGVAQFAPDADATANLAAIAGLVHTAAERGARVVVFPEYSSYFVDPFDESLVDNAQPIEGPFTRELTRLAAAAEVVIVAGLVERADGGRVRNTAVAVGEQGVLAIYRKLHLYDAFGQRESDWIEAGEITEPQLFDVDGFRLGLMTCYDLRFPEVTRRLADAGADAVLVPAEWVRGPLKEFHWQTLLAARAIENTFAMAASDHRPPLGVGHSAVLDPQGVTIASVGTGDGVAVGVIERAMIDRVRAVNPALALRRFAVVPAEPRS